MTLPGAIRYTDSGAWFDRARIFLNTSSIEGFPNTFLQAWIRGVPVVSFFDPDGLIRRLQLGRVATSIDDMREAIRSLLETDTHRETIGRRARDFAAREFTSAAAARYLELLETKSAARARRRGPTKEPFHDHPRTADASMGRPGAGRRRDRRTSPRRGPTRCSSSTTSDSAARSARSCGSPIGSRKRA